MHEPLLGGGTNKGTKSIEDSSTFPIATLTQVGANMNEKFGEKSKKVPNLFHSAKVMYYNEGQLSNIYT